MRWETEDASHTAPTLSAAFSPHLFQFSSYTCLATEMPLAQICMNKQNCILFPGLMKVLWNTGFSTQKLDGHPLYGECVNPAAAQIENMARACFYFPSKLAIQRGNKAPFITFMAAASGLRNEPHISRPPFLCIGKLLFCCMPFWECVCYTDWEI